MAQGSGVAFVVGEKALSKRGTYTSVLLLPARISRDNKGNLSSINEHQESAVTDGAPSRRPGAERAFYPPPFGISIVSVPA
eukprot:1637138-Rhodomonas_salina.2